MAYVFINPVTARMAEPIALSDALKANGHTRVTCVKDWSAHVLREVEARLKAGRVIDARCPLAARRVPEDLRPFAAPRLPILLYCAKELSERKALTDQEIIVTTPCEALVGQGNALGLSNVRFVTARAFLDSLGGVPRAPLEQSPIPMGFYDSLPCRVLRLTGAEEIRRGLQRIPEDVQIVEMLYCPGGCHRGDGI